MQTGIPENVYKALVLDDDPLMRDLYVIILKRARFEVAAAADVAEARAALSREGADVILVDVHLSGTDGLEFTRELSQRADFLHVPVIALSATAGDAMEKRALQSGCAGFIAKPINPKTFGTQVAGYVTAAAQGSVRSPIPDEAITRMRGEFLKRALEEVADLQARNDQQLLSDAALAKAAHRWAGASGLEGLPDVLSLARSLEDLANRKNPGELNRIRAELALVGERYQENDVAPASSAAEKAKA